MGALNADGRDEVDSGGCRLFITPFLICFLKNLRSHRWIRAVMLVTDGNGDDGESHGSDDGNHGDDG